MDLNPFYPKTDGLISAGAGNLVPWKVGACASAEGVEGARLRAKDL